VPLDAQAAVLDPACDSSDEHERRGVRGLVTDVLAELSGRVSASSYQILRLRWIEGRSLPEIAAALGLTPAQVRFRHHRVKQKFRRLVVERIAARSYPDRSQGDIAEREVLAKNADLRATSGTLLRVFLMTGRLIVGSGSLEPGHRDLTPRRTCRDRIRGTIVTAFTLGERGGG
jgi:hypothetical protein